MRRMSWSLCLFFLGHAISSLCYANEDCEKKILLKNKETNILKNSQAQNFLYIKYGKLGILKLKNKLLITYKKKRDLDSLPKVCQRILKIKVPIKKLALTSTTHLPFVDILDETQALKGFSGVKYIYNKKIQRLIQQKKVLDLNFPIDLEKLVVSKTNILITDIWSKHNSCKKLKKLNIICINFFEFEEDSALGRSEWLKVFGVLFDKLDKAQELYSIIEKNYYRIKKKAQKDAIRNTKKNIIVGELKNDHFRVPGGKSYLAKFIKDAGANYIFSNDTSYKMKQIKIEKLKSLLIGRKIDFWLPQNNWIDKSEALKQNKKYSLFNFFHTARAYNNSKLISPKGGNDYYESALVRPDLVLQDLVNLLYEKESKAGLRWYRPL